MNRYPRCQLPLMLVLLGHLVSLPLTVHAQDLSEPPGMAPRLVEVVVDSAQGVIIVTGEHFIPGGRVSIALFDRGGVHVIASRTVTATEATLGMNGSRDPALGYLAGGTVLESFAIAETVYGPNGSRDPAIGYRLGLDGSSVAAEVFGPNGSRDPAMIGVTGDAREDQVASTCDPALIVVALDEQQDLWSNMLDVGAECRLASTRP